MLMCGCVRGRLGCNTAIALIRQCAEAYAEGVRTGHWGTFDATRDAVERHYRPG
jgi:hypothetical protein